MDRCVSRLDDKDAQKKQQRWQKLCEEAAKQSGRGIVPEVGETLSFEAAIEEAKSAALVLFPYECEKECSLKSALRGKEPDTVSVFIGPEGGFSDAEVETARNSGFAVVTLGTRILRTETAGAVTCGNILYETEG